SMDGSEETIEKLCVLPPWPPPPPTDWARTPGERVPAVVILVSPSSVTLTALDWLPLPPAPPSTTEAFSARPPLLPATLRFRDKAADKAKTWPPAPPPPPIDCARIPCA